MWKAVIGVVVTLILFIITSLIMSKRSTYTTITPLPEGVTRTTVLETLHSHTEMIDLNPLVKERHPIKPPAKASPEEYHCQWYEITDTVQYLPGGVLSGSVSFNACFHDLADGIQTHIYAPMGLEIRGRWTVGGSLPGEPQGPVEIGKGIPLSGLYLREDGIVKCNILLAGIVKKNLKHGHVLLVQRIIARAQLEDAKELSLRRTNTSPIIDNSSYQNPLAHTLSQTQYESLHFTTQSSPDYPPPLLPTDSSLYPAPLNIPSQSQANDQYPPQHDPRSSAHFYGGPVYQHPDPVHAATNPHWQPQVPLTAQTQASYHQHQIQLPLQQPMSYANAPQERVTADPLKKKDSDYKAGVDPAGPPAHPGMEPAELQ